MAVTCARCGTQNPDGNQFCQACGTPLAVAAVQAAPAAPSPLLPGPPPAPPPPGAYQSPYYAPGAVGPQPPVHRTPWMIIIAAIVVLVLIMAGAGTAIALLSKHNDNQTNATVLPSPSPASVPSPTTGPQPSPLPTPTTTSTGTVSNNALSLTLPSGWTVVNQDNSTISVTNASNNGSMSVGSGTPPNAPQTAQQNKDSIDKSFSSQYPDTKPCSGSKTVSGSLSGAQGLAWVLCFTLSGGGQSVPAAALLFAGANPSGSVYYVVLLLTTQANFKQFVTDAGPILSSIQWKLS
jgi:hypothetical protein